MASLTLVIGNKNYSSWSLRPWLFLKHGGIPFAEIRIPLHTHETRERIAQYSPSVRVPVLLDGVVRVWESLAICEYIAERFPEACGWPIDQHARAIARSVATEMHAGFSALRAELPMNCRAKRSGVVPSSAARADIERALSIWRTCRETFGQGGPWLFGAFTIADAMFAPVALRFYTYGVELPNMAREYVSTVNEHSAIHEWIQAARDETEVIEGEERGNPVQ
jgi:glutathione S-transferase